MNITRILWVAVQPLVALPFPVPISVEVSSREIQRKRIVRGVTYLGQNPFSPDDSKCTTGTDVEKKGKSCMFRMDICSNICA